MKGFSLVIIYLLLVKWAAFLPSPLSEKEIVIGQLYNPFPSLPNEELNFVKIVTILGLYLNSFSQTLYFLSDLAVGAREVVRFHSSTVFDYHLKMTYFIMKQYMFEYVVFALSVCSVCFLGRQGVTLLDLGSFLLSLFVVDFFLLDMIGRYSNTSIIVLLTFFLGVLLRYSFSHYLILLFVIWLLQVGVDFMKERRK